MSDDTKAIIKKCEQYWNEPGPFTDAEVHNILEFIHWYAMRATVEIDRLQYFLQDTPTTSPLGGNGDTPDV